MLLLIILLLLTIAFIVLACTIYSETWELTFGITGSFSGVLFLLCLISFLTAPISYRRFAAEREALEATLLESRTSGSEIERAGIITEVTEWNQKLNVRKMYNKTFLLDLTVDDRIEELEYIK